MTSFSTSHAAAQGSGAASPEVLVRAYKAEIQQLTDTLHELAVRDSGSSSLGFTEVLEGKYLAQIKKARALSVQLGTAQQQLIEAQKALQIEREKTSRLVAAATFTTPPSTKEKKSSGGGGAKRSAGRSGGGENDDKDDDEDAERKNTESASAAAQRAYDQLHQKEILLAEVQRENAALRSLVQREVGLRDDPAEVDALLKRASAEAGTSGWRGRAEELVLLRSKLKDAQRRAEAIASTMENATHDADDNTEADSLALPASVRAYLGMPELSHADVRSAATTTTATATVSRRRDVDDEARDRLASLQQQRAAQLQQSIVDRERQQRELQEEKLRTAALQARVKTLKTELDTQRAYVETILDKSTTDDELVEAYKAELHRTQEDVRQWQKKAAAAAAKDGHGNSENSPAAMAVRGGAAARSAPYRKEAQQLVSPTSQSPPPPEHQRQQSAQHSVDAVVYKWVLRACQEESPAVPQERDTTASANGAAATPSTAAMAAVLRSALHHVAQVERQATDATALLDQARRVGKEDNEVAGTEGGAGGAAATAQIEKALMTENAALKKRIRALADMMEREVKAQKVLWNSHVASVVAVSDKSKE